MSQFAERIHDVSDIDIETGLTAQEWADAHADGIVGDKTTDAPNVRYVNQVTPPMGRQWNNAILGAYTGIVVGYIGSKPDDR